MGLGPQVGAEYRKTRPEPDPLPFLVLVKRFFILFYFICFKFWFNGDCIMIYMLCAFFSMNFNNVWIEDFNVWFIKVFFFFFFSFISSFCSLKCVQFIIVTSYDELITNKVL